MRRNQWLNQTRRESMVVIVRPDINRGRPMRDMLLSDYVEVPRLSLYGTYSLESMVRFTRGSNS